MSYFQKYRSVYITKTGKNLILAKYCHKERLVYGLTKKLFPLAYLLLHFLLAVVLEFRT